MIAIRHAGCVHTHSVGPLLSRVYQLNDDDARLLHNFFGPSMPPDVQSTMTVSVWMLERMPWLNVHPILREGLCKALNEAELALTEAVELVFEPLVDVVPREVAHAAQLCTHAQTAMLARRDGTRVDGRIIMNGLPRAEQRFWFGAAATADAATHAARGFGADAEMARAAWRAIEFLNEWPKEEDAEATQQRKVVRGLAEQLADVVRSWSPPFRL